MICRKCRMKNFVLRFLQKSGEDLFVCTLMVSLTFSITVMLEYDIRIENVTYLGVGTS